MPHLVVRTKNNQKSLIAFKKRNIDAFSPLFYDESGLCLRFLTPSYIFLSNIRLVASDLYGLADVLGFEHLVNTKQRRRVDFNYIDSRLTIKDAIVSQLKLSSNIAKERAIRIDLGEELPPEPVLIVQPSFAVGDRVVVKNDFFKGQSAIIHRIGKATAQVFIGEMALELPLSMLDNAF